MVYCGLFPIDNKDYNDLREALEKLQLNDASLNLNQNHHKHWDLDLEQVLRYATYGNYSREN